MPLAVSIDFSALVNRSVLEFVFSAVDAIRRHVGVLAGPGLRVPLVQHRLQRLHVRVLLLGGQLALHVLVLGQPRVIRGDDLALLLSLSRGLALRGFFAGGQLLPLGTICVSNLGYVPVGVQ